MKVKHLVVYNDLDKAKFGCQNASYGELWVNKCGETVCIATVLKIIFEDIGR